ncbi:MAG: hypothetical protein Q9195_003273 [Heterodermia aff. obscurata]
MAKHKAAGQSHLSTDLDTTQQTKPASLETLPNEILAAILGILLRERIIAAHISFLESYPYTRKKDTYDDDDLEAGSAPGNDNAWSFLYVRQRFHAEAVRYFHEWPYAIDINERSLFRTKQEGINAAFIADKEGNFSLPLANPYSRPRLTGRVFPGLMLSQIRKLIIEIQPTDLRIFWHKVKNALDSLCKEQLLPRGPLKSLSINLRDMQSSEEWQELAQDAEDQVCLAPAGSIAFEDYEGALRRLKEVIALSDRCKIRLPYWMERHPGKARLLKTFEGKLGARVLFTRAPNKRRSEAMHREECNLVALPEEYLPPRRGR